MPEYARTYVEQKGSRELSFDELCDIAKHQIEEMESLSASETSGLTAKRSNSVSGLGQTWKRSQICFFDTDLIVTKVWFDYAFGRVPEWLNEAIKRFPMDVYLLTYPDLPWKPDPARYNGSDEMRMELYERYKAEIETLNIPYYIITHC